MSVTKENVFKRYHLNIWTESDVRWLSADMWGNCNGAVDLASLYGEPCYAGLDLASVRDLTALVLYWPHDGSVLPYFWVPDEGMVNRSRKDRVPYVEWVSERHIEKTEGNVVDYDVIRKRVNELGKRFNIAEIALDRWNSTHLQTQLQGDGFECVPFGQGFASMSGPTKELEKLVLAGQIKHGDNPVLRWMSGNVQVEMDAAGNMKPSKEKSREKIDGIVALTMAIGRAMVATEQKYDTQELLMV